MIKEMKTTRLIIAGGFLGAGKTTLLREAALTLIKNGLHVGLITNDQAPELVDSKLLSMNNIPVAEVSGSCFCCNFNGFTDAICNIRREAAADIIIAEPVGSCTDLSATIMQPLKQFWGSELEIAPLTVLTDPARLDDILNGKNAGLHPDAAYIFRKQLEESDIILINKSDLLTADGIASLRKRTAETYPSATILTVSALNGTGVGEWLNEVSTRNDAGKRLAEVDYDVYANGEAVLGWLNGTVSLHGENTDWDAFTRTLLTNLADGFDEKNYPVGHVKVISENGKAYIAGNLTGNKDTLVTRGSAGYGNSVKMIINARVETSPETLNTIVRGTLGKMSANKYKTDVHAWRYLQPGRPNPTHRYKETV